MASVDDLTGMASCHATWGAPATVLGSNLLGVGRALNLDPDASPTTLLQVKTYSFETTLGSTSLRRLEFRLARTQL